MATFWINTPCWYRCPLLVQLVVALGSNLVWVWQLSRSTCPELAYMTPLSGYNLFLMRAPWPARAFIQEHLFACIPVCAGDGGALVLVMVSRSLALLAARSVYSK